MRTRTSPRTPLTVPVSTRPSSSGTVTSMLVAGSTRYLADAASSGSTCARICWSVAPPRVAGGMWPRRRSAAAASSRGMPSSAACSSRSPTAQRSRPPSVEGEAVVELRLVAGQGRAEPRPEERADGVLQGGRQVLEVELVGVGRRRSGVRAAAGGAVRRRVRAAARSSTSKLNGSLAAEPPGHEVALVDRLERVVDDVVARRRCRRGRPRRCRRRRAARRRGPRAVASAPVRSSAPEYTTTRCCWALVTASRNS